MKQAIHPFPARMAPEVALEALKQVDVNGVVLDPMCGAGTVLLKAIESGRTAIGYDPDPLAVLMSTVLTREADVSFVKSQVAELIRLASMMSDQDAYLPWIDDDEETREFIGLWFEEKQRNQLRKIAFLVAQTRGDMRDLLSLALSKTIITKKRGASLAWDVAHSRPHKMKVLNDYDVLKGFEDAANRIARLLGSSSTQGTASVRLGDARSLSDLDSEAVDAIVTSPPYLNGIDYIRGHKFSLVWLGYRLRELRNIRSTNIGAERGLPIGEETAASLLMIERGSLGDLPRRMLRIMLRYVEDMAKVLAECHRVLRDVGRIVLVVGDSRIQGVPVSNSSMVTAVANLVGLREEARYERPILSSRRYLPPPDRESHIKLSRRMRIETILTLRKS